MKKTLTVMAVVMAFTTSPLRASVLDFRVLIDGVEQAVHALTGGTHSLEIEARVTNNLIGPNNDIPGGLISATVNLGDSGNALDFEEDKDGFGVLNNKWKNTKNANFDTFFPGELNLNGFDVFGQLGAINPPLAFGDQSLIGDGAFANIFTGNFDYDGINDTTLNLVANANEQTVAGFTSAIVAVLADTVNGTSTMITTGIPEPGALILAGMGLIGMAFSRRRLS